MNLKRITADEAEALFFLGVPLYVKAQHYHRYSNLHYYCECQHGKWVDKGDRDRPDSLVRVQMRTEPDYLDHDEHKRFFGWDEIYVECE